MCIKYSTSVKQNTCWVARICSYNIVTYTYSKVYDNGGNQHAKALNNVSEDVYVGGSNVDVGTASAGRPVVAVRFETAATVRV